MGARGADIMQHDLFGAPPVPHGRRSGGEEAARRLRELARPDMVRVAPDRHAWVPRDRAAPPPDYCLCRWARTADGFAPVPVAGRFARLTGGLLRTLGFPTERRRHRADTLHRLARAGYIDLVHVSPGCHLLDLDSWYRHMAECAENPEMWEEGGQDRQAYLHANGLGGWKGRGKGGAE